MSGDRPDNLPRCGNCYFARELRADHQGKRFGALACWGAPPQLIKTGERRIPGIRAGAILEPDRIEPIYQTENVPVLPERPPCALWQCKDCGAAQIFLDYEHVCLGRHPPKGQPQ